MSKLGEWLRRELSGPTGRPLFGTMVIHRGGMLAVLVPGIIAIGLERRRRDAAAPT